MTGNGRWPLMILAGYCCLSEIQVGRLANPTADRLVDLSLGGIAVMGFLVLFLIDRPSLDLFIGKPVGWLGLLAVAGLVLAPFSLAPIATVQRSAVAIAAVGAVTILVRRYQFEPVLAAVGLGTAGLVFGSLAWEIVGPGSPPSEIPGFIDTGFAGLPRHLGLTHQPNQLGRVSATLLIAGALLVGNDRYRVRGWVFQGLALGGLFYAQSRTAIVVGLAVLAIAHVRGGRARAVMAIGAVAAVAGVWLWASGALGVDALTRTGAGTEELTTATGRTTVWQLAFDLGRQQPLTGVGAFASEQALHPTVVDGRAGFEAHDAHNLVLNVFLTQGLLGVLLLGAFALSAWLNTMKSQAVVGAGSMLVLAGGLGLTENLFWKSNSTFVFLIVGAVGSALFAISQSGATSSIDVATLKQDSYNSDKVFYVEA